MPNTAKTWEEMRQKAFESYIMRSPIQSNKIDVEHKNILNAMFLQQQKENANRRARELARDQATAAAIRAGMGIATPAPPAVPKTNFTAENLAFLNEAARFARGKEPTELEKAFAGLAQAEKTGKKKKRTRRRHRTRSRK